MRLIWTQKPKRRIRKTNFLNKHRELIRYIIAGALTTLVSIGSFYLFERILSVDHLIANILSWIFAVLFAYVINRIWVFESKKKRGEGVLKEFLLFVGARITSLAIEEAVLFAGVDLLKIDSIIVKTGAQIIVLIINYLFSKLVIFHKDS